MKKKFKNGSKQRDDSLRKVKESIPLGPLSARVETPVGKRRMLSFKIPITKSTSQATTSKKALRNLLSTAKASL